MNTLKSAFALCLCVIALAGCRQQATTMEQRINIIFDTDIGNDIDDAEALALLNKYIDDGRINLLGICLNKEGEQTARYVDIMNSFYGHTGIPMARARDNGGDGTEIEEAYTSQVCALTAEDGTPIFATAGVDYENLPDGHILYRKLLSEQPDSSVVIVSVGFLTNLARLMDTPGDEYSPLTGKELVEKKVKFLSIMAGRFFDEEPEYNVMINIPAAQKLFKEWPARIVALPWELGEIVRYPAESMENDYSWVPAHPLKEAYIRYGEMPYSNWMFDPTAVLYAVEGESMFTCSEPGTIDVDDKGVTRFTASPDGKHFHITLTPEQAKALIDHSVDLLTAKPACFEEK